MNRNQQLELEFNLPPRHRYEALDRSSEEEELHEKTVGAKSEAAASYTQRGTSDGTAALIHILPSGNPYSRIPQGTDGEDNFAHEEPIQRLSRYTFTSEACRILRQYSPTVGKRRRLRPEFRQFVEDAAMAPAAKRADILAKLKRYDVEASGYGQPLFNRELSDRMLKLLDKMKQ